MNPVRFQHHHRGVSEPGGRDRIKRTVPHTLVLIQAAQIVMAGDQPSPQMFILRSTIMLTLRQSPRSVRAS